MLVNFWGCEFGEYDESWDGENEVRIYMCTHNCGDGSCGLDNKYNDERIECKLLDKNG